MIRILEKHKILILLAIVVSVTLACSDSFEKGQKVWVKIPGSSFADESYAVGKYVKRSKTRIVISPLKVVSSNKSRRIQSLRVKPTAIPASWVSEYESGKERYGKLQQAVRLINGLNKNRSKAPTKDFEQVIEIASQYNLDELSSAAKIIKLRNQYFSRPLSFQERFNNVREVLTDLEKMSKENNTHKHLLNSGRVMISYEFSNAERTKILPSVRITSRTERRNKHKYKLFISNAVALLRHLEKQLDSSTDGGMEALDVINNIADIMKAEEAYLKFITYNGLRLRKLNIDDVLAFRKKQIANSLVTMLRSELKMKHEFYKITSMAEANAKYTQILNEARNIENDYGIKIYRVSDKNRLFMRPAKKRLEKLVEDEEEVYLVATDYTLEPVNQKEMIDTYLSNYPKGKYREQVKAELSNVEVRQKEYARTNKAKKKRMNKSLVGQNILARQAG